MASTLGPARGPSLDPHGASGVSTLPAATAYGCMRPGLPAQGYPAGLDSELLHDEGGWVRLEGEAVHEGGADEEGVDVLPVEVERGPPGFEGTPFDRESNRLGCGRTAISEPHGGQRAGGTEAESAAGPHGFTQTRIEGSRHSLTAKPVDEDATYPGGPAKWPV